VFGRTQTVTRGGKRVKLAVPENEWVRLDKPELRIVPQPLWDAVQVRRETMFKTHLRGRDGRLNGRPEQRASEHLLSGFCVCGECGARLVVWCASAKKSSSNARYLYCWAYKSRGGAVCKNKRGVPLEPLTRQIVAHFREDVLTVARVAQAQMDLAA